MMTASFANADPTIVRPETIPQAQLDSYKLAFILAFDALPLRCHKVSGNFFGGNIFLAPGILQQTIADDTVSATIDTSSAQPLLVFTEIVGNQRIDVSVTTSADFKKVISVKTEDFIMGQVNVGTIQSPVIQPGYVSTHAVAVCDQPL